MTGSDVGWPDSMQTVQMGPVALYWQSSNNGGPFVCWDPKLFGFDKHAFHKSSEPSACRRLAGGRSLSLNARRGRSNAIFAAA